MPGPEMLLPVTSGHPYDVVVVDGESVRGDPAARRRVLRQLMCAPRERAALFVCSTLPGEQEVEDAKLADDYVRSGWARAERARRRVQLVGFAAWRRSTAVRRRAEAGRHLRLVPQQAQVAPEAPAVLRIEVRETSSGADMHGESRVVAIVPREKRRCETAGAAW